jgi:predicted deacetylase
VRIVISSLGERLTNRVSKPRVLQKWYQVRISRAKTASEKQRLAKEYMEVRKQRLIEALKVQPKTAREIELTRKITEMLQSR